jgi:acyl phosphate:glycerol-3-phosphate acyltransferase
LDWRVGLITAIIWALTVYISKYSSLGALIALSLSPIFMFYFKVVSEGEWIYVGYCILTAAYIIYKHQANIQRLLNGTEPKVGQKKVEKETETDKT